MPRVKKPVVQKDVSSSSSDVTVVHGAENHLCPLLHLAGYRSAAAGPCDTYPCDPSALLPWLGKDPGTLKAWSVPNRAVVSLVLIDP